MKHDKKTRARAVALLLDGNSYTDVEAKTGVGYNTLKVWKSRFKNGEIETVKPLQDETEKTKPTKPRKVAETPRVMRTETPVETEAVKSLLDFETLDDFLKRKNETENPFQDVIYTPPVEKAAEIVKNTAETASYTWKDAGLIAAVVILCAASILSVGLVLAHAFPVWIGGYMIATVVCTAPVLLLLSKRVTVTIAWVTMILAFVVEVVCNAVAICVKIETETETGILKAVGQLSLETVGNIAFAWLLGLALPALALCFEVLLLKNQEN